MPKSQLLSHINRMNGLGTYNVCGDGILYTGIFHHLLIHQWQSSPDIRQHGNLRLGLLGLRGTNRRIDHIRVKLLYVREFIYLYTSCHKNTQPMQYFKFLINLHHLGWFFPAKSQSLTGDYIIMIQHHI